MFCFSLVLCLEMKPSQGLFKHILHYTSIKLDFTLLSANWRSDAISECDPFLKGYISALRHANEVPFSPILCVFLLFQWQTVKVGFYTQCQAKPANMDNQLVLVFYQLVKCETELLPVVSGHNEVEGTTHHVRPLLAVDINTNNSFAQSGL